MIGEGSASACLCEEQRNLVTQIPVRDEAIYCPTADEPPMNNHHQETKISSPFFVANIDILRYILFKEGPMHRLVSLVAFIVNLAAVAPSLSAQDYGAPDTVRYSPIRVLPYSCASGVNAEIRFYLACDDDRLNAIRFDIDWSSSMVLDSVTLLNAWAQVETNTFIIPVSDISNRVFIAVKDGVFMPSKGDCAALHLHFDPSDTIIAEISCESFFLTNPFFDQWTPTSCDLGATPPIHANELGIDGDADLSGQVSISDAVFTINYIFSGGCAPYDLNSADPNADCLVTISDAVYLINYIFAGGSPPQPGCVN